jgi:hypothetical protein
MLTGCTTKPARKRIECFAVGLIFSPNSEWIRVGQMATQKHPYSFPASTATSLTSVLYVLAK